MAARLWSSPLEFYTEPSAFLGIKLAWNPWTKGTAVATQDSFYFFKPDKQNAQICSDVFDLSTLLVQSPEADYETKKTFCFVLRHGNRPKGEKLSLAAIDSNSYHEWLDFLQFASADFQVKMIRFLNIKAAIVQKHFRGYHERKNFIETVEKVIRLQAVVRGLQARMARKRSIAAIVTMQAIGRMFLAKQLVFKMKLAKNVTKYHAHRTNVVKEMLATEETYVKDLESVMRFYYTPLKTLFPDVEVTSPTTGKKPQVVPNSLNFLDINTIFSNLPEIHEHHVSFLARLKGVVEGWNENAVVGNLFIDMSAWLDIYIIYCNNFDGVTANIERCKKNDIFRKVIESFTDVKDMKKLTLESILITPVQRLPRYEMLVRDLLKHTWPQHPDYRDLQKALGILRQSVTLVNEARRKDSTKKKVAQFQDRFRNPGELEKILGEGNFITEGAAKFYDEQNRSTKAYLVLFDDQLVFAKRFSDLKKDGKLNYKKTFRFADAKSFYLSQIPAAVEPFDEQLDKDKKDEKEYGFKFAYEGKLYRFTVEAAIPRGKWVRDLNEAWKKLQPEA